MGPPGKKEAPSAGASIAELTSTTSPAVTDDSTARRLADLETRVSKLEKKKPRRKPKGCITNENGDIFVPGAGWIRRSAAA